MSCRRRVGNGSSGLRNRRATARRTSWIIETRGRVWEGTTARGDAMSDGCERVSASTCRTWRYRRVDPVRLDAVEAPTLGDLLTRL